MLHWVLWSKGLLCFMQASQMNLAPIWLSSRRAKELVSIQQHNLHESHKALGVYVTLTGCKSAQADALCEKLWRICNLVLSSNFLGILETLMARKTTWYPMVSHSLGVTTMTQQQIRKIQSMATQPIILSKMELNRNFPAW